jgi:hypothetical protein
LYKIGRKPKTEIIIATRARICLGVSLAANGKVRTNAPAMATERNTAVLNQLIFPKLVTAFLPELSEEHPDWPN